MENDRVPGDLWGKSNVPVVLNNPYSEAEQVRGRGWGCFGWENQNSQGLWECDPSWRALTAQRTCRDKVWPQKLEVMDPRGCLGQELQWLWFRQGMEVTGE